MAEFQRKRPKSLCTLGRKNIEVTLYTPWYLSIADIENFDIIETSGTKIKVRKLESLREDMREQLKNMADYRSLKFRGLYGDAITRQVKIIRAKARRIKKLFDSGVFEK